MLPYLSESDRDWQCAYYPGARDAISTLGRAIEAVVDLVAAFRNADCVSKDMMRWAESVALPGLTADAVDDGWAHLIAWTGLPYHCDAGVPTWQGVCPSVKNRIRVNLGRELVSNPMVSAPALMRLRSIDYQIHRLRAEANPLWSLLQLETPALRSIGQQHAELKAAATGIRTSRLESILWGGNRNLLGYSLRDGTPQPEGPCYVRSNKTRPIEDPGDIMESIEVKGYEKVSARWLYLWDAAPGPGWGY